MARRPNYGQERAERQRKKAARRDERLAAKSERRQKSALPDDLAASVALENPERPTSDGISAALPADRIAMLRIGNALKFLCGADHPVTRAVQRAAETGTDDDIGNARALFMQLPPGNQCAALTMAGAASPAPR